jgi:uncharacterized Zn finger protein
MTCPICGSEDYEILKSKGNKTKQLLVQCSECNHTYREVVEEEPEAYEINIRVIISEFENSWQTKVKFFSDEYLESGTILYIDDKDVEVTSIENKKGVRVNECPVIDIKTIWAKSLDKPVRLGVSIDNHGTVFSHKIEVDQDFIFTIGDVSIIKGMKFEVYGFKTLERRMRTGYAYAKVIKRVYGKLLPEKSKSKIKYDLTEYVVKTTIKEK